MSRDWRVWRQVEIEFRVELGVGLRVDLQPTLGVLWRWPEASFFGAKKVDLGHLAKLPGVANDDGPSTLLRLLAARCPSMGRWSCPAPAGCCTTSPCSAPQSSPTHIIDSLRWDEVAKSSTSKKVNSREI